MPFWKVIRNVTYDTFFTGVSTTSALRRARDSVQTVPNFSTSADAKAQTAEDFIDHSLLEKNEASYGDAGSDHSVDSYDETLYEKAGRLELTCRIDERDLRSEIPSHRG